jgi:hypothetical protein
MADENTPNEPTPNEVVPDPRLIVDDTTKEFLDEYVGPGKKYANIGELAKGYANADKHLFEVTRDAGKFKTEAESLKELLMENLANPTPNDGNNEPIPNSNPTEPTPPNQPPASEPPKEERNESVDDLKARVKDALEEVKTEDKRKNNARMTEEASLKHFGSKEDALKAIEAKAEELGVSPQWIANLAFDSPKAYFVTMGIDPDHAPKSNSTPAPRSDVNPTSLDQRNSGVAKEGSYRWYMELRRTNPGKFRSQEIQTAMMKAAVDNPNFYS